MKITRAMTRIRWRCSHCVDSDVSITTASAEEIRDSIPHTIARPKPVGVAPLLVISARLAECRA